MNQLGIQKGDHVALIFQNCPHFFIAYYALMRIGAVSIPINPMYTLDEMSYIVDNGDVKWIIAGEDSIGQINQLSNKFSQIKGSILCDKDSSHLFHDRQEGEFYSLLSFNKAFIFYEAGIAAKRTILRSFLYIWNDWPS